MTAQQLKNSILQMAVQGKLVPQDPNDEPASVLLERIRAEKEQLIKEGKIKREKNPSVIFRGADNIPYEKIGDEVRSLADEIPFEIPDSWEWVRVKTCAELFNGKAFKPSDWAQSGLPIVRIQNLNDPKALFNYYNKEVAEDVHLYGGELLFAWSGTPGTSFGAHIWHGNEAVLNQHIFKIVFDERSLFKPYFMFALNERVGALIKAAHGSAGLQHVTRGVFESTLIPLPPFSEQQRIVSKLQQITPLIEKYGAAYHASEALDVNFPYALKKSILQTAIQGKLVPQDPSDEPAEVLLARIREEKAQLVKEGKIKKDQHESIIFRRDNSHYEMVGGVERCIDDELPFEIPESWCWVRLGSILEIARGGSPRPIKNYITDDPNGVNWIKIGDTDKGGKYIYSTKEKIKLSGVSKSRFVYEGDFLLTNSMSFGRPYILKTNGCIHDGWLVLSDRYKCYFVDFLYYLLSSTFAYYQFCDRVSGAVVKNLNRDKVADSLFPLPPLSEQQRIVKKIEAILPVVNGL